MTDFYYQIKAKGDSDCWRWPPLHSGMVTADDKKQAKAMVDDEYGQVFPQRVLKKDIADHHYLLTITEIQDWDDRTRELFEEKPCTRCGKSFRRIDLYNDHNETYKGPEYCSQSCTDADREDRLHAKADEYKFEGSYKPVIYCITNKLTGKQYVGQTSQAFTLRWYQHFYHAGSTEFHTAIKNSKLTDWEFCILEQIDVKRHDEGRAKLISQREQFWIDELNTIENGYNTATAAKSEQERAA